MEKNYDKMSLTVLRELAKEQKLTGIHSKKKSELIVALQEVDQLNGTTKMTPIKPVVTIKPVVSKEPVVTKETVVKDEPKVVESATCGSGATCGSLAVLLRLHSRIRFVGKNKIILLYSKIKLC